MAAAEAVRKVRRVSLRGMSRIMSGMEREMQTKADGMNGAGRIRCRAWPACTQSAGRSAVVVSSPATPAARCDMAVLSGGTPQSCPRAKSRPGVGREFGWFGIVVLTLRARMLTSRGA